MPTYAPGMMGNTVVWKPASSAVYPAWVILEVLEEAGSPCFRTQSAPWGGCAMPRPDVDLFALLRTLATGGVDFIVIGGVGAVLQGAPIATFDLDLVHSRDPGNIDRLAAALAALKAYYREHQEERHVPGPMHLSGRENHLLMTDAGPMDLLGAVTGGRGYEDLVGHSVDVEIEPGLIIKVLDLATIIRLKEELGGEKDMAALPILRRTLEQRDKTA